MIKRFLERFSKQPETIQPPTFSPKEIETIKLTITNNIKEQVEKIWLESVSNISIEAQNLSSRLELILEIDPDSTDTTTNGYVGYIAGGGASLSIGDAEARTSPENLLKAEELQNSIETVFNDMALEAKRTSFGWYDKVQIKVLPKETISINDLDKQINIKFLLGWTISKK